MKPNIYKPILFNTEMVQAILAGRKTQTRRIVNPQPKEGIITSEDWNKIFWTSKIKIEDNPDRFEITETFKPKYKTGDILWVRETWQTSYNEISNTWDPIYKGDGKFWMDDDGPMKWKPSLFMQKKHCRIFLRVKNVRCERLQDINRGDGMSEGCPFANMAKESNPVDWFSNLWDSINAKKHPWKSNPWVWVYEFEKIEKPADFN